MKKVFTLFSMAALAVLMSCGGTQRPDWTRRVPPDDGQNTYFTGVSKTHVVGDLAGARRDAAQSARKEITDTISSDIKTKLSEVKVTEGAISEKVDPGLASEQINRILSQAIVRMAKVVEFYDENEKKGGGIRTFVLMKYSKEQLKKALKEDSEREAKKLAAEAALEANAKKKRQIQAAQKALEAMKKVDF